jgi:hypothetical protein
MNDRIVFLNTGWMDFYKGILNDTITGGGKHVASEGWGHEMFNFKEFKGNVYGFVQPYIDKKYGNPSIIKIEKIDISDDVDKLSKVTVVWTANDPINGGTYIIGWYLNATVYRNQQPSPKGSNRLYNNISLGFYATTKSKYAKLLSVDERIFHIRRQEKNWMGQSNVWYADNNPDFINLVKNYIYNGRIPTKAQKSTNPKGSSRQIDPLKRIEVEKNAVKVVTKHYRKLGYEVQSVEKDNVGWDLIATNDKVELKLEVKGLSGNSIVTELTPNEFKNLNADRKLYRLCIVTEALTNNPKLKVFSYSNDNKEWTSEDGTILNFQEIISARIYA